MDEHRTLRLTALLQFVIVSLSRRIQSPGGDRQYHY
jgi:hypothetical protein